MPNYDADMPNIKGQRINMVEFSLSFGVTFCSFEASCYINPNMPLGLYFAVSNRLRIFWITFCNFEPSCYINPNLPLGLPFAVSKQLHLSF